VHQADSEQKLGLDLLKNQVPIKWRLNPKVAKVRKGLHRYSAKWADLWAD